MEENQASQTPVAQQQVGFPAPQDAGEKKSGVLKWIIVIIGLIVIVVAGIFFIMSGDTGDSSSNVDSQADDTSDSLSTFPTPELTATPEPTPTAAPEPVDKSEIKVEVLNGTGTPGDAGLVKEAVEELGFDDVEADNADEQDETETTITYSRDIDQATIDELVASMEELFETVKTRRGTVAGDFDIRILTGEKKSSSASETEEETTEE